ncbi:MAG TPA: hypothetical protein PKD92_04140 [Novosphingobium sp.]|nr:hypothetical protein [Novosphingobium sp.]HMP55744.1 hypothetical protein [Novosphingobium sp.]
MSSHRKSVAVAALAAVLVPVGAGASDATVERRLNEQNLAYNIDSDGDYRTTFNYTADKRTQLVYVSGKTETVSGVQIREIFSPAARMEADGVSGTKAIALMEDSSGQKVGAWEIRGGTLYFVIKYPEPMSATQLRALMNAAATAADNMEIEISGSKDAL